MIVTLAVGAAPSGAAAATAWSLVPSNERLELNFPVTPLYQASVEVPDAQLPTLVLDPVAAVETVKLYPLPEASYAVVPSHSSNLYQATGPPRL